MLVGLFISSAEGEEHACCALKWAREGEPSSKKHSSRSLAPQRARQALVQQQFTGALPKVRAQGNVSAAHRTRTIQLTPNTVGAAAAAVHEAALPTHELKEAGTEEGA